MAKVFKFKQLQITFLSHSLYTINVGGVLGYLKEIESDSIVELNVYLLVLPFDTFMVTELES